MIFPSDVLDVAITPSEALDAADVGVARALDSLFSGRKPRFSYADRFSLWHTHIVGALGELAASKALGVSWQLGVNTFKAADVGDVEVRWCGSSPMSLKVADEDPDGRVVVAVSGQPPVMRVHGWILAADAKRPEFRDDPGGYGRPAFFVNGDQLRPMRLLTARAVS